MIFKDLKALEDMLKEIELICYVLELWMMWKGRWQTKSHLLNKLIYCP